MARLRTNYTRTIRESVEIAIGAALLAGLVVRYVIGWSQPDTFRAGVVAGLALALFWLVRPLVGWLLGMPQPPGVPRWWAKRNTGVLAALAWGGVVFALAFYRWGWRTESALDIAIYNALGVAAFWLMKPLIIWLVSSLKNTVAALGRLRAPGLPRINWNRSGANTTLDEQAKLLKLTPREFEELCAAIARSWGYQARAVGESGDGGIDVQMWKDGQFIVAQCKRYTGTVPIGNVRDFYGAMLHAGAQRGYFFTTARFSSGAYEFVKGKQIELVDGLAVIRALSRHRVPLPAGD